MPTRGWRSYGRPTTEIGGSNDRSSRAHTRQRQWAGTRLEPCPWLRLAAAAAGCPGHAVCGQTYGSATQRVRLASVDAAGLRPGSAWVVHRKCHRRRDGVRTGSAGLVRLHPVAVVRLLQRTRAGRHRVQRLGCRHQGRHQGGQFRRRVPGNAVAVRHRDVRSEAAEALLSSPRRRTRRCSTRRSRHWAT